MSHPRLRPPLLLFVVALLAAGAIGWGGAMLAKRERVERVERDRGELERFADELQGRLDSLEDQYRDHLEDLCRSDLEDRFSLRDALDAVVGIRQLSTLESSGAVDVHRLASHVDADEAEMPLPLFDVDDLPVGRSAHHVFEDRRLFGNAKDGASGWVERDDSLYFFHNVSSRRTVLLLIERPAVAEAVQDWLRPWLTAGITASFGGQGADAVRASGRSIAAVGNLPERDPDLVMPLRSRFGSWRIRSWDPRHRIVEYDSGILAGSGLLALLVLGAGGLASFHLRRALRIAAQRVSFVNQVSHELRTPLTNILLNADLAAESRGEPDRRRLAMIRDETRRLTRLIDNVLAFSRSERGGLELQARPVDLASLVREVAEQFGSSLERRGVDVRIEDGAPPSALADSDAVAQILGNLLSNIEKYAAGGGLAHIAIEPGPDGEEVVVRVSDRGPGVAASDRDRIFRPFRRLDDRVAEGASGAGLGLAIARDLALRMGGSLGLVDSGSGETGATFELRLPAAAETGGDADVIEFPASRAS